MTNFWPPWNVRVAKGLRKREGKKNNALFFFYVGREKNKTRKWELELREDGLLICILTRVVWKSIIVDERSSLHVRPLPAFPRHIQGVAPNKNCPKGDFNTGKKESLILWDWTDKIRAVFAGLFLCGQGGGLVDGLMGTNEFLCGREKSVHDAVIGVYSL